MIAGNAMKWAKGCIDMPLWLMSSAVMVIDDDFEWDLLFTNLTMAEQRISGGRFTWGTAETLSDDLTCDQEAATSIRLSTRSTSKKNL